ncbi:hypothetical protein AGR7C_Cc110223 [Agrobacterium deltaense Zutra 3/1]|uniref:Uncharacterized protein n=1 Tax=Agrobacterium deltaense Zutra 3/1 TaxID=1183427 RepID=A0A1S7P201_9HYPH|nr:hypothetical protein AGR7C_Cc110223 [Agrobacterium deltaense Zutra 3/1]
MESGGKTCRTVPHRACRNRPENTMGRSVTGAFSGGYGGKTPTGVSSAFGLKGRTIRCRKRLPRPSRTMSMPWPMRMRA